MKASLRDESPLGLKERRRLHGQEYVDRFEKEQSWRRLGRLTSHFDLPPAAVVADFACGNGMLLELLGDRVGTYHGVDFSPEFISAADARRRRLGADNATFHCEAIEDFCARRPDTFDAGFAMDVSEHIYDDEWVEILKAVRPALKPGGRFYLHTPNAEFFLEIMKDRGFLVKQFPEHVAVRTAAENAALIEKAGLRIREVHFLPHYNSLRYAHGLSRLPFVGRFFRARLLVVAERSR